MTIPALIALNLFIGASTAFSARVQIRTLQRHVFTTRYFIALMMLETMIVLPIGAYFYIFYTDWSWMYLVNSTNLESAVGAMAVMTYPMAASLGYLVGYNSARSGSDWITLMFLAFIGAGLVGLAAAAKNQFVMVGTYEQYHRDVGLKSIWVTSLVPSISAAGAGIVISWVHLLIRFSKEGRARSQSF